MRRVENDCCDCGLPCKGNMCPLRKVPHFYCDKCGDEKPLYEFANEQLCAECILDRLTKVEGSE